MFLSFLSHGPFESLVKTIDPCSEKCIYMHPIKIVRFTEASKHFSSLEAINYFVAYIHY